MRPARDCDGSAGKAGYDVSIGSSGYRSNLGVVTVMSNLPFLSGIRVETIMQVSINVPAGYGCEARTISVDHDDFMDIVRFVLGQCGNSNCNTFKAAEVLYDSVSFTSREG